MGDSECINETVETIDMLIVSAIEQLEKQNKKRSDEHAILEYLQKKRKQYISTNIMTKYIFP